MFKCLVRTLYIGISVSLCKCPYCFMRWLRFVSHCFFGFVFLLSDCSLSPFRAALSAYNGVLWKQVSWTLFVVHVGHWLFMRCCSPLWLAPLSWECVQKLINLQYKYKYKTSKWIVRGHGSDTVVILVAQRLMKRLLSMQIFSCINGLNALRLFPSGMKDFPQLPTKAEWKYILYNNVVHHTIIASKFHRFPNDNVFNEIIPYSFWSTDQRYPSFDVPVCFLSFINI